jgi:myo-inositol-1(or 4)-monophosphatase
MPGRSRVAGHFPEPFMAARIDPRHFLEVLLPLVRQCARASLIFYGQVPPIGKAADTSLIGQQAQQASTIFTALDSGLQDILLSGVLQHFPFVRVIAEEDTPLKRRFSGNSSEYAVILDPIDGSVHFAQGDASYHISIGLARQGLMQAAMVARPDQDKIFTALRGQGAYVQQGKGRPRRLKLPSRPRTNRIFISSKARPYQELARPALEPREHPIGAALVLTQLAEGALCAYLTRQVEVYDVGPPSLIAEEAGARCFLRNGRAPRYARRRKFDHYLAAATPHLEQTLFAILRRARREGYP